MARPNVGYATLSIIPSARGFQRALDREVGAPVANVGDRQGSRLGGFLMAGIRRTGVAVAATTGAALTTALVKGWGRLTAIEDAQAALRGIGHDAESIERIMDSALASVRGTAFGLGDAATIAATAVAAGVEPGEQLTRTLTLTANAAALARTGLDEMGSILNKVWTAGKVQTDELNQLADRGIPIWTKLAEHFGVTATELREMVSRGEVDAATFAEVLEGTVGNAAEEMGRTTRGALANVGAAFGRLGASLLSGVFPKLAPLLTNFIGVLDRIAPAASQVGEAIGTWIGRAFDRLSSIDLSGVASTVRVLIDRGRELAVEVLARLSEVDLSAWFSVLSDAAGRFSAVVERLAPFVATVLVGGFIAFVGLLKEAVNFLAPVAGFLAGMLLTALEGVASAVEWVARNWDTLRPILMVVGGILATILIPHWIRLGVEAAASSVKQVAAWVAGRRAAAASAASHVRDSYRIIAGWVRQAAAAVRSGATTARIWLMYRMDSIRAARAVVAAKASMIAAWVRQAAAATVQAAKTAAAWLMGIIRPAAQATAAMVAAIARQVASWALLGAQALLHAAKVAAAWLISMGPIILVGAAVAALVVLVIKHWDTIKNAVAAAAQWVADRLASIWNGIKSAASAAWDGLRAIIARVLDVVKNLFFNWTAPGLIIRHWDTIKNAAGTAWGFIREKVDGFLNFFREVPGKISNFASGMWDGIKEAFRTALNWIIDRWNGLEFRVPSINTPLGSFGGFTLGVPDIPRLAAGGIVRARPGGILANIGEGGVDEAVVPLDGRFHGLGGQTVIRFDADDRHLKAWLRSAVRIDGGGDVQVAFGS